MPKHRVWHMRFLRFNLKVMDVLDVLETQCLRRRAHPARWAFERVDVADVLGYRRGVQVMLDKCKGAVSLRDDRLRMVAKKKPSPYLRVPRYGYETCGP
jgi:hypothetical protein